MLRSLPTVASYFARTISLSGESNLAWAMFSHYRLGYSSLGLLPRIAKGMEEVETFPARSSS